jgi:hypothetical protein
LILSGSGTKTMPDTALRVHGNFTINGTASASAASALTIEENIILGNGTTLAMNNYDITVGSTVANSGGISVGASAVYSQTGGTTTIKSSSGGAATIGGAGAITFNNLYFAPDVASAPTFTLGSASSETITVSNNMTIGDGTNSVIVTALNNDPTLDINGDFTIASAGAFVASDTGTFRVAGSWSNSATGEFTHSGGIVIFDDIVGGKTISDGGDAFFKITFNGAGGSWFYQNSASTAPNLTTVTNGTATFLNAKTGANPSVAAGGALNVDWYLGTHIVDANNTAMDIDTGDADITISENSGTPQATVWRHNGTIWGSGATSQTTGTASNGINPQPNSDGAIRIREYTNIAGTPTYYLYNLVVDWQAVYGQYDYYDDYGDKYLTSSLNSSAGDKTISDSWHREAAGSMNGSKEYDGVNNPPTQGSWYAGLASGLDVSITGTTITFANLNLENSFTNTASTQTQITVTTSATNGYAVTAWETQKMTHNDFPAIEIDNWLGDYDTPVAWTGNCANDTECGFGFTSDDSPYSGSGYAGFPIGSSAPIIVADSPGPISGNANNISYRISAPNTQLPGTYSTTIVYVVTAEY